MHFKIGDKVIFLREKGHGTIIRPASSSSYWVLDNDGFERKYTSKDLVKDGGFKYSYSTQQIDAKIQQTKGLKKKSSTNKNADIVIVDLHIENLIADHSGLSNGEILNLQLNHLKSAFGKALKSKAKKCIVVHGVGEGVLKREVRIYLQQFDFEFHDADYRQFGAGATEIRLRRI
jgi:hypothetical protein